MQLELTTKLDLKRNLNVFKADPGFEQTEAEWAAIRADLMDTESEADDDDDEDDDGSGDEDESDVEAAPAAALQTQVRV